MKKTNLILHIIPLIIVLISCTEKEEMTTQHSASDGDIIGVVGDGDILVFKGDLYGNWVDGVYDVSEEAHGDRTTQTFQKYADEGTYQMIESEGGLGIVIDVVFEQYITSTDEQTSIISSSADGKEVYEIPEVYNDYVTKLNKYNILTISSLENQGVDGIIDEDGNAIASLHPHGPTNTIIATSNTGIIDKTIFVGVIYRWGNGGVDLEEFELFEDHTIFVKLNTENGDIAESTSHAAPKLAALATNILAKNKNLTAEELKVEIFKLCTKQDLTIQDSKDDDNDQEYEDNTQVRNVYVLEF